MEFHSTPLSVSCNELIGAHIFAADAGCNRRGGASMMPMNVRDMNSSSEAKQPVTHTHELQHLCAWQVHCFISGA
jgi:hypothetical protein